MTAAGFSRGNRVGAWVVSRDIDGTPTNIEVDLMVPEAVGGAGSRAARLVGHAKHVARKTRGLEAALVDTHTTVIAALDAADTRSFSVAAAGPAALIVSKIHKIRERLAERAKRRLDDKDALDVLRLLRAAPTEALAATFVQLLGRERVHHGHRRGAHGAQRAFRGPAGRRRTNGGAVGWCAGRAG